MKKTVLFNLIIIGVSFIVTGCSSNFKIKTNETDGNGWYDGELNEVKVSPDK